MGSRGPGISLCAVSIYASRHLCAEGLRAMTTKRFIAGAVCPSCGQQDSVRMYTENGENYRECVECHYSDVMEKDPSLAGKPPVTRVSPEDRKSDDDAKKDSAVQIVRILDQQP